MSAGMLQWVTLYAELGENGVHKKVMVDPSQVVALEEVDNAQTVIRLAGGLYYTVAGPINTVRAAIVTAHKTERGIL